VATGIEPDGEAASIVSEKEIFKGFLQEAKLPEGYFDAIL
jgi:hypothetical protein